MQIDMYVSISDMQRNMCKYNCTYTYTAVALCTCFSLVL